MSSAYDSIAGTGAVPPVTPVPRVNRPDADASEGKRHTQKKGPRGKRKRDSRRESQHHIDEYV